MNTITTVTTAGAAVPPVAAAPPTADALQVSTLRAMFRQSPIALIGNVLGMVMVAAIFGPVADGRVLAAWLVMTFFFWALRLLQWLRYGPRSQVDDAAVLCQRWSLSVLVLAQAGMWGMGAWLFWSYGASFHQTALILMLLTYCLGAVQVLSNQPRLFISFVCLIFVPAIVRVAVDTALPYHLPLAGLMVLLFAATVLMGYAYRGALSDAVVLRARTEQLAAQLRAENIVADAARREAEAANRAKTQFFAAASHDLRQPLHAMGLFAEALRQRSHDPEVAALVNSINESVDALEGLFGELLDITRIDTGGVDVQPAPVKLRDLFARLRLNFEPVAFEKGLALSFHGERHVAHTDPVLLERILRNLVSNAIRYTEDGGVLVSCRTRGEKLLVQVWDSGIGIADTSLPHIFDEFYQVQSGRPLEPHHRKGLGLGLSIVKRLALLLNAPLTVRSRVHRGTVFSMMVPLGVDQRTADRVPGGDRVPLGLTLQGRLIVVVEDEPSVRDGLVVLLKGWGARVLSFDSVNAVKGWVASTALERPDLLIVDYRLPAATTGLEILDVVRQACPRGDGGVPAIVVTGSSLGGHETEAATHDFHLLIKPVLPNKLRAMIAFKLGVR